MIKILFCKCIIILLLSIMSVIQRRYTHNYYDIAVVANRCFMYKMHEILRMRNFQVTIYPHQIDKHIIY